MTSGWKMSAKVTLAVACAIAVTSPPRAVADTPSAAAPDGSAPARATSTDNLNEVTVTGSRIRRAVPDIPQPITVLGGEDIRERGISNVADALNEMPAIGVPTGPVGGQGGNSIGRNYVNLFNLGSQRTLVLLNGRRFVSGNPPSSPSVTDQGSQASTVGGGSQVDLNNIPVGLIDRVETISAGGAAVYGSDAVAGVVNIITKKHFEGIEADAQYGNASLHDYPTHNARITAGMNFNDQRGNVVLNFENSGTGSLIETDREFSASGVSTVTNPLKGQPGQPDTIHIQNWRFAEFTATGVPFTRPVPVPIPPCGSGGRPALCIAKDASGSPVQFDASGNLVPYNIGTYYQPAFSSGGDGFSIQSVTPLVTSVKRNVGTALARYDLTDHLRLSSELLFSHVDATEPTTQGISNAVLSAPPNDAMFFTLANPYLSDQARGVLASRGVNAFWLSRMNLDVVGSNAARAVSRTSRGLLALDGDLSFGERNFYWNTSASLGNVDGSFTQAGINQNRFLNGLDAVRTPSGDIVCASTLANPGSSDPDIRDCKPLNVFGANTVSDEAREYVGATFGQDYTNKQTDVTANFGGDIFDLPAGAFSFTAGVEYRRESGDFQPNEASAAGLGRDIPVIGQGGKYNTKEEYVEVLLPVAGKDFTLPAVYRFELNGSFRHVDHSLAGGKNVWSVGANWNPIRDLTIRGTRSTTFRAPSLTELFLPSSTQSSAGEDPCDARHINGGPNPSVRAVNCQVLFNSLGLGANYQLTSVAENFGVDAINSGDPTLKNEDAKSWSVGATYQPEFIPGLAFGLDHVKIDITNAIATFDMPAILSACYDDPNFPSDVCGRFTRDAQGQVQTMNTGFVNAGFYNFQGDSFNVEYRFPAQSWGSIRTSVDAFHLKNLQQSISGLGFDLHQYAGEIGIPEWSGSFKLSYSLKAFGASWTTRYVGSSVFDNNDTAQTTDILGVGSYLKHDLVLRYDVMKDITVRAGVNNLTNKFPPYPISYANGGTYDVIGRAWFVGASAKF